jgi:hypothetical protein
MHLTGCGGSDEDKQSAANDLKVVTSADYPSLVCKGQREAAFASRLGMRKSAASAAARNNAKLVWRAYGHSVDSGFPSFGSDTSFVFRFPRRTFHTTQGI